MVYNIKSKMFHRGDWAMTRSEIIKFACQKNNISISELARRIGQTPQNLNKKIIRNTVSDEELSEIFAKLNIVYEQKIIFADDTLLELKTNI